MRPRAVLSAGFTLIELLVAISIVSIISGVIIFQYSKFDSQLLLRNLSYEVALAIREAQVLSVSVRGVSNDFDRPYGVHFDSTSGNNTTYILFRDVNSDFDYDPGEGMQTYTIARRNYVSQLCADADCTLKELDILFLRPDPDGRFHYVQSNDSEGSTAGNVTVQVTSGRDAASSRTIRVYATGQISTQ